MTHYYPIEIFYEDTDAAGVVYYANYIKYMERARTVMMREKGISLTTLLDTCGIQFVVKTVQVSYEKPARLQQNLTVATKITKYGGASLTFSQSLYFNPADEQSIICSGETVVVCTNLSMKPCAIPASVLGELKSEN